MFYPLKERLIAEFRLSTKKVSYPAKKKVSFVMNDCGEAKLLEPLDLLDICIITSIIRLNSFFILT